MSLQPVEEPLDPQALTILRKGIKWKDWEPTARMYARVVVNQAARTGKTLEFDDALQEIAMIWMRAKENFDPFKGASFRTYFIRSILYHARVIAHRHTDYATKNAISIGSMVNDEGMQFDCEDENAKSPEREVMAREGLERIEKRHPMLSTIIRLMQEQPDELMQELIAAQSHFEYGKSLGFAMESPPVALTPRVIGRCLGLNWRQRSLLLKEMEVASRYV